MTHTDSSPALSSKLDSALEALHDLKSASDIDVWRRNLVEFIAGELATNRDAITRIARAHPLLAALHEDPYHHRAWNKPRGYPGDAVMLDMIYDGGFDATAHPHVSELGRKVFETWNRCDGCQAVRERARHIAREIERTATETPDAKILSVACGHLRELEQVHPTFWPLVSEVVGFDQDAESIARVETDLHTLPVRSSLGKVRDLIRGEDELGNGWDLIYSVGLFDYLNAGVASRLVKTLFDKLEPNGRLLIANFRDVPELAWGHVFQDWRLVCREPSDLAHLVQGIECNSRTYVGSHDIIAWLEVTRMVAT